MKQKKKLFYLSFLVSFMLLLASCESEKEFMETTENSKQLKREISFKKFKEEIMQPNFNKKISLSNISARTLEEFEIDTTIVKALEKEYLTYTMKLDPKFTVDGNKFYNLIVYRDNANEIIKKVVEYYPQSQLLSYNSQDIHSYLTNALKQVAYSSNVTSPFCPTIVWELTCTCEGHRYGDPICTCGTFVPSSYTILTPCTTGGNTGSTNPPNDNPDPNYNNGNSETPITSDPVLPAPNVDNCNDLKSKSYNQEFKNKMNELKTDSNGYFEAGFQMFANAPKFSDKKYGTLHDPSGINFEVPTRNDCTGFMHCHLNNSTNQNENNFAIFTPMDFTGLTSMLINSNRPLNEITMYLTVNVGSNNFTYAIKIQDLNKFIEMCMNMNNEPERYKRMWEKKIKADNTPEKQVNEFLKILQDEKFDEAVELYKCDDNYQNWEQLILNATKNTIKIKC